MRNEVKRYALSPYNDAGGYAPQMVEVEKLPNPEKREIFYRASDYAALEAECERLRQDIKNAFNDDLKMATMKQQEQEIIDLRTQLEAIRAAGGEEVEVVGYMTTADKNGPMKAFNYTKIAADTQHINWARLSAAITTEPLMTVAQHQRIVAAMAAELELIHERNDALARDLALCAVERERFRAELEAARKQEIGGTEDERH